jgi:hypothetical protein
MSFIEKTSFFVKFSVPIAVAIWRGYGRFREFSRVANCFLDHVLGACFSGFRDEQTSRFLESYGVSPAIITAKDMNLRVSKLRFVPVFPRFLELFQNNPSLLSSPF